MFGANFRSYLISLFSLVVLVTYQNCGDVAFKRVSPKPGGTGGLSDCSFNSWQLDIAPTTAHINDPIAFSLTSDPVPARIEWDLGDGSSADVNSFSHSYSSAGVKSGTVSIWKDNDCTPQIASFSITILDDAVVCPPVFDLSISGPNSGSIGESLAFVVNSPACMNLGMLWSFGDSEPVPGTMLIINPTQHAWTHSGIFVVTSDVTDAISGDSVLLSHLVDIQGTCPALADLFISGPDVGFVNENLSFFVNVPGCWQVQNITWHKGSSPDETSVLNPASFAYAMPGVYTVTADLAVIPGGVTPPSQFVHLSHQVTILPISDICPSMDQIELSGPTVGDVGEVLNFHLHIPSCFNFSSAEWEWQDSTANGSGIDTNHAFQKPGDYNILVRVRTVLGSPITIIRRVHIRAPLVTPTPTPTATATPNPCPTCNWVVVWSSCTGACGINQGTQNPSYECRDASGLTHPANQCPMVMPTPPPPRACTVQMCGYRFTYILSPCSGGICSPNSPTATGSQSVISYQCQGQDQNGAWTNLPEEDCIIHGVNPDLSPRPCARACLSCDGGSHGQRISWFDVASVACNQACPAPHVSTCNDGAWSPQAPGAIRSCVVNPVVQQARFVPAVRSELQMTLGQLSAACVDPVYPDPASSYQYIYTHPGEPQKARFADTCGKRVCVQTFGSHAAGVLVSAIPSTYLPNTVGTIRCEKPTAMQPPPQCVSYVDTQSIDHIVRSVSDVTSICASLGAPRWDRTYVKSCGDLVCRASSTGTRAYTNGYLVEWASSMGATCFREAPVYADMFLGQPLN